jgi:quinol monooxygenase YgiN
LCSNEKEENMTHVLLIAHVEIAPERADAFEAAFRDVARVVRQEPGCIFYEGYRGQEEPELFYFRECFADADAMKAHSDSPHLQAFFKKVMPWVVSGPTGHRVQLIE